MEEIKTVESGEPLVDLAEYCPGLIIDIGVDPSGRKRKAYLRKTVAEMICRAKSYLPDGMTFIIGDAWRSKEVQERNILFFHNMFAKNHPEWTAERVKEEAENYIAPAGGPIVSGHMTGGAVDLRLWKNGRKIPMKSWTLTYQENSKSDQPKLPEFIKKNREIMFRALEKAGLSNYPLEFWHWSYGDWQWAKRNGKHTAIYGVIEKLPSA